MASGIPRQGVLRVVSGADTTTQIERDAQSRAALNQPPQPEATKLASYIINQYWIMRYHRDDSARGWSDRLLKALRAFNGQYDPDVLADIQRFGGSTVYDRITASKCRGTSSLLRDVYLGADKSWGLVPDADPDIPPEVLQSIQTLIHSELQAIMSQPGPNGEQAQLPEASMISDRVMQLTEAARQAAKEKAAAQTKVAQDKIETILDEGGFYHALAEFLSDLPLFPFACIKGPTVRLRTEVQWVAGSGGQKRAVTKTIPKLIWSRVSPFDMLWTPGVADIADATVIERLRITRADLNDLLDLPGYNQDEIRAVLDEYGRGGLSDIWDQNDSERSVLESREDPRLNRSEMINGLEMQGNVQGRMLLEWGMHTSEIPDPMRDYFVEAWLIGTHVIKVQLAASPRKRHQYYVTSFEKVPGTVVGNGLPDILADIQTMCNALLRAVINNSSISSGPQVVVNDDRLSSGEDGESMFPWKRWHVKSDPMGNNTEKAIDFFQPQSNAQSLLQTYASFSELADERSAIPRYMTGAQTGSIGRTASGLSMLMSNVSKILQTVAANIDGDVMEGILGGLYDMIMLTDTTGLLTGDEEIRVLGVNVAVQKETQRARQLEFLQVTNNPTDMQIIGPKGRAQILRPVADTLGLPGESIVPSDEQLTAQQQAAAKAAAAQNMPGHAGMGAPGPGGPSGPAQAQGNQPQQVVNGNQGPTTNTVTPTIQGGPQ